MPKDPKNHSLNWGGSRKNSGGARPGSGPKPKYPILKATGVSFSLYEWEKRYLLYHYKKMSAVARALVPKTLTYLIKQRIITDYNPGGISVVDVAVLVQSWSKDFTLTERDGRHILTYKSSVQAVETIEVELTREQAQEVREKIENL